MGTVTSCKWDYNSYKSRVITPVAYLWGATTSHNHGYDWWRGPPWSNDSPFAEKSRDSMSHHLRKLIDRRSFDWMCLPRNPWRKGDDSRIFWTNFAHGPRLQPFFGGSYRSIYSMSRGVQVILCFTSTWIRLSSSFMLIHIFSGRNWSQVVFLLLKADQQMMSVT